MLRENWRRQTLPGLQGAVLDLGAGSGQALSHLTGAAQVHCVEPRPGRRLREAAATCGAAVDAGRAEALPYPAASFDAVVCSAVLCSVRDQALALRELHRVLRPHGTVVFFEHIGSAPGTGSRRAQGIVRPFSKLFDGGCDPTRDTVAALEQSPLEIENLDRYPTRGPFSLETILIAGLARRTPQPVR